MKLLKDKILSDGEVLGGEVLKVDSFLNHQMDVALLDEIGKEFHRRFADLKITKVLTIEASGIAIAYAAARCFGVPMVFAKKAKSVNIDGDMYTAEVESFTHKNKNQVIVSKKFLSGARTLAFGKPHKNQKFLKILKELFSKSSLSGV